MGDNFLSRPLSVGKLADLAGVALTTLSNWQTRGLFEPFFQTRSTGGHRQYAAVDALRLVLVAKLTRWHIPVEIAVQCVDNAVGPKFGTLATYRKTPIGAVFASLTGFRMRIQNTGPRWTAMLYHENNGAPDDEYVEDFYEIRLRPTCEIVLLQLGMELGLIDPATGALIEQAAVQKSEKEHTQ